MSDFRLKDEIEGLQPSLAGIRELTPSTYVYKNSKDRMKTIGFIAQEVEEIFPELVHQKGEYLALAYDNFAVLSIKGIQELADLRAQDVKVQEVQRKK